MRFSSWVQEYGFLRSRGTPEHCVAPGKAPKAGDLFAVAERIGIITAACPQALGDQRNASVLVGEVLRMHERQVEEDAQRGRHTPVEAGFERAFGGGARGGVAGESLGAASEHVARE